MICRAVRGVLGQNHGTCCHERQSDHDVYPVHLLRARHTRRAAGDGRSGVLSACSASTLGGVPGQVL